MATLNWTTPNGTTGSLDLSKVVTSVVTGTSNGTIAVNGTNVSIKGLGSAAYTTSTDYLGATATAAASTKLATARTIDGVDFNGTAAIMHYGTCGTAAGTAAKTVSCTSYKLVTGSRIVVKFTVTNTAANPTLNVNSTGAKAIQYRGAAITAGYLAANRTYEFIYDGTNYQLVGDIDTNSTYSAMTAAEATTGTATTARSITAKVLHDKISEVADDKIADIDTGVMSVTTGSANGTLSVDGTDVAVKGLGTAAYTASTAYAAASHGNHVPATQTANNAVFLRNDNSWQTVTPANIGAAAASHTHKYAGSSSAGGVATSAAKLETARAIDGVNFDGSAAITHYGTCSTAAATAAKTVACTSFTLVTGSRIVVKFTVTNTAANPTLNVNSTGAKAIQYRGSAIGAGNLAANRTYEFIYDGSKYQLVGDLDTNTQNVTGVKGNSESSYRTGNVNITAANIGAATSDHNHDSNYVKISGEDIIIGNKTFDNPIYRYAGGLDPSSTSNLEQATTIMKDTNNLMIGQDMYSVNAYYIEHKMRVINSNLTDEGVNNWADLSIRTTSDKKTSVLINKHGNLTLDLPSGDSTNKIPTTQWVQGELGGYSKTSHTHSYLPLSGGTLTNRLTINRANGGTGGGLKLTGAGQNFAISIQNTNVTKGTKPSSLQYWGIDFYGNDIDNYNKRIGMVEGQLTADNVSSIYLRAYDCTSNTNTSTSSIGVHVNGSGAVYTSAPTPSTTDDSTKIATTAYVKSNLSSYLPLSGGTLTGTIHMNGSNGSGGYIGSTYTGIRFIGGSDFAITKGGAALDLDGRENNGTFRLTSSLDTTDDHKGRLEGTHDGTLTWNGRYVLVHGVNGTTQRGYQTGQVTTSSIAANSSGTGSVIFDLEFGGTPRIMVCLGGDASNASVSFSNPTKSGFNYRVSNMSSSSHVYYVHWMAIY